MMTFTNDLEDTLDFFYEEAEKTQSGNTYHDLRLKYVTAIKQLVAEQIIGEDEPDTYYTLGGKVDHYYEDKKGANQLRTQQRKALEE
jgi:hypothetical protein